MKNLRIVIIIAIGLAIGALIVQNIWMVKVRWLFFTLEMPLIVLLLLCIGAGFLLGKMISISVKGK